MSQLYVTRNACGTVQVHTSKPVKAGNLWCVQGKGYSLAIPEEYASFVGLPNFRETKEPLPVVMLPMPTEETIASTPIYNQIYHLGMEEEKKRWEAAANDSFERLGINHCKEPVVTVPMVEFSESFETREKALEELKFTDGRGIALINGVTQYFSKSDLDAFKDLYERSFPNENEREVFEDIVNRFSNQVGKPSSFMLLYKVDGSVVGGAVYDWYKDVGALELIYVAVEPEYRKQGICKALTVDATNTLQLQCNNRVKYIFLEVEDPGAVEQPDGVMDANQRFVVYGKLGFGIVPINYVQPPLSDGKEPVRNLLLMARPIGDASYSLNSAYLIKFLEAFYRGLDCEGHPDLFNIVMDIKSRDQKTLTLCRSNIYYFNNNEDKGRLGD